MDGGAGCKGVVITVTEYLHARNRGVHVTWNSSGVTNLYRWGHDGRFDVKVLSSRVGEQQQQDERSGYTVSGPSLVLCASTSDGEAAAGAGTSAGENRIPFPLTLPHSSIA